MDKLRLADLLAALSQASDLGMGQPPETAIRSCLVATTFARQMGISERDVGSIYYATLLQHVGCTAYAHETAALFGGDDIALRAGGAKVDFGNTRESLAYLLLGIGKGQSPRTRAHAVFTALRYGQTFDQELYRSNCEVAVHIANRLDLDAIVQRGLNEMYERWDGKGNPHHLTGDDISLPARFAQVASQAVLFHGIGGPDVAIDVVRRRAGTTLDPTLAHAFADNGAELLAGCDSVDASIAMIDAEPEPRLRIPESHLEQVASAFAVMVDLKSPFFHGHSAGVSELAGAGAIELGIPEPEVVNIRLAGLLHDLGRVGVPSGIWDKPGPLTTSEWEQVRLHPYYSERILSRSSALAHLAMLAGMHHERMDGSGYHRQSAASAIPMGARLLAAADTYQAMTEARAYRPARTPAEAASELESEVEQGRLDAEVVRAILSVAGHAPARAAITWPANLTEREVQVLRLAARGKSNREIADALFISPKTADHHVQHIYAKIGVSTRAGAAIFAMEHDLIRDHHSIE